MAATASPYGLRPINRIDGMPYAGATQTFLIDQRFGRYSANHCCGFPYCGLC
jgi:hypothetical protein